MRAMLLLNDAENEGDNDDGCNYRMMLVGMMALMMLLKYYSCKGNTLIRLNLYGSDV